MSKIAELIRVNHVLDRDEMNIECKLHANSNVMIKENEDRASAKKA